ncbi:Hypothetical protein FKW44_015095, partial [Caligus rogercresseyi]
MPKGPPGSEEDSLPEGERNPSHDDEESSNPPSPSTCDRLCPNSVSENEGSKG